MCIVFNRVVSAQTANRRMFRHAGSGLCISREGVIHPSFPLASREVEIEAHEDLPFSC